MVAVVIIGLAMRPTYDQLVELVAARAEQIALLRAENAEFRERVAELERRLDHNSRNSAKPLSSDGWPSLHPSRAAQVQMGKTSRQALE